MLAPWEGLEPATDGFEGRCSIQLSYQDVKTFYNKKTPLG